MYTVNKYLFLNMNVSQGTLQSWTLWLVKNKFQEWRKRRGLGNNLGMQWVLLPRSHIPLPGFTFLTGWALMFKTTATLNVLPYLWKLSSMSHVKERTWRKNHFSSMWVLQIPLWHCILHCIIWVWPILYGFQGEKKTTSHHLPLDPTWQEKRNALTARDIWEVGF